jgi:hypothetical protein
MEEANGGHRLCLVRELQEPDAKQVLPREMSSKETTHQCQEPQSWRVLTADDYQGEVMPLTSVTSDSNGNHYTAELVGTCEHGWTFRKTGEITEAHFKSIFPDNEKP